MSRRKPTRAETARFNRILDAAASRPDDLELIGHCMNVVASVHLAHADSAWLSEVAWRQPWMLERAFAAASALCTHREQRRAS